LSLELPDERQKLPLPNPIGLHSLPSSLSSDLGNSCDPPQCCLLPLLVSSGQKARGCGNMMDNGLFFPHCNAMAWIGTAERTLPEQTIMWANAQHDGRPGECTWCPLFNAAKFGRCLILECCAVMLPRRETR